MESIYMDDMQYCSFCHKLFLDDEKPFIPVKDDVAFHWECYIKMIQEQKTPVYAWEEEYEEQYVEV